MDDKREVIELVNRLQGYRATTGCNINLQLPQIVVVGAQSSGKSSVLDGLVGSSILPRGSDTVTKCPIIVQLITTPDPDDEGIEFQDAPVDGRIKDYDIVRSKIKDRMEAGGGAIRDEPIIIKVYSPNVVTLTVVDLPGIKRLTTSGEPDDLEQLTSKLSRKYINEKNAIILAVSPANYDICNSDGILLAKKADPKGDRTIGVLTKLDLMDDGTNARSLLTGTSKNVQVKLGMIGLVNRSQKDIDDNLTVEEQIKKEAKFLKATYPDLVDTNGIPFLRKRLHELLVHHISKCLPNILRNMEGLLIACQKRMDAIPAVITKEEKFRFVGKIIQRFENCMKKEIEGCTRNPAYNHLHGGVKIKEVFEKKFAKDMDVAGKQKNECVTDEMIRTAFRNSGSFDSFFVYPEAVFRRLAQEHVKHLEKPALKCAERVHEEILRIADHHLDEQQHSLGLFPELRKALKSVVQEMLTSKLDEVKSQIKNYIKVQASIIFWLNKSVNEQVSDLRRKLENNLHWEVDYSTDSEREDRHLPSTSTSIIDNGRPMFSFTPNPNLSQFSSAPVSVPNVKKKRAPVSNDEVLLKLQHPNTINLIKQMVNLYFDHIKMQTQDYIPKLVADRLITQFSSDDGDLGNELRIHLMDNFEKLLCLPPYISSQLERDMKDAEHLKVVISEIKGLHDSHKYVDDSGYSDMGSISDDDF